MCLYWQYSNSILLFLSCCGFGWQLINILHDLTLDHDYLLYGTVWNACFPLCGSDCSHIPGLSSGPLLLHYLSFSSSLLLQSESWTMAGMKEEEPLIRRDSHAGEIDLNNRDPKQINEDVAAVQIIYFLFKLLFMITSSITEVHKYA